MHGGFAGNNELIAIFERITQHYTGLESGVMLLFPWPNWGNPTFVHRWSYPILVDKMGLDKKVDYV